MYVFYTVGEWISLGNGNPWRMVWNICMVLTFCCKGKEEREQVRGLMDSRKGRVARLIGGI